ncbi:hypothetical protein [Acinetobacter sp. AGC35]
MVLSFLFVSIVGIVFITPKELTYSNIFIFIFSMYCGAAALIVKAFLGQSLQKNLMNPLESVIYLVIGFLVISLCAILAKIIVGNRVLSIGDKIQKRSFLENSALILILLGIFVKILHALLGTGAEDTSSAFGGFGSLSFIFLLGSIFSFYLYSQDYSKRNGYLVACLAFLVLLISIFNNTKKEVIDFILLASLCIIAFKIKIKFKVFAYAAFLFLFLFLFLSPLLHLMRSDYKGLSFNERIDYAYSIAKDNDFNPIKLYEAESLIMQGFSYSYAEYSSYIYPNSLNLDRAFLILPIDQVSREINLNNKPTMGITPFVEETFESILPSFLISKDPETGPDLVAWNYGIRSTGSVARPVIGFIASSLAASGLTGVILYPFFILMPFFMFMEFFFGKINGRIWGVFGCILTYQFVEKEIDQILPFVFRNGVIILVFIYIFYKLNSKFRIS